MKNTRIDLSQPFEQILTRVLSLPRGHARASKNGTGEDGDVKQVLRGLYEAANGRQVETVLGLIQIAPPVAPFLKEEPFEVATQLDFLVEAMSRVIAGPLRMIAAEGSAKEASPANERFASVPAEALVNGKMFTSRLGSEAESSRLPPQGVSHG
jgi:hypothetical protein